MSFDAFCDVITCPGVFYESLNERRSAISRFSLSMRRFYLSHSQLQDTGTTISLSCINDVVASSNLFHQCYPTKFS